MIRFDGQDMNTLEVGCKSKRVKVEAQYMSVLLKAPSLYDPKHWSTCLKKAEEILK